VFTQRNHARYNDSESAVHSQLVGHVLLSPAVAEDVAGIPAAIGPLGPTASARSCSY